MEARWREMRPVCERKQLAFRPRCALLEGRFVAYGRECAVTLRSAQPGEGRADSITARAGAEGFAGGLARPEIGGRTGTRCKEEAAASHSAQGFPPCSSFRAPARSTRSPAPPPQTQQARPSRSTTTWTRIASHGWSCLRRWIPEQAQEVLAEWVVAHGALDRLVLAGRLQSDV